MMVGEEKDRPERQVHRTMKNVRRGYCPDDEKQFSPESLKKMSHCALEAAFLLERGYPVKSAITFTGNRRQLSARQRSALGRMTVCPARLRLRKAHELERLEPGCVVNVDAFNAVVIMETALSGSVVLRCMDGCIRDLSGLSGTYAVITVTDEAIRRILEKLRSLGAAGAVFWIDSPVSNSGRLKTHIAEQAQELGFPVDLRMVHDADKELKGCDHVVSGDSEVIEACGSWYNLYADLLADLPDAWVVALDPK